MATTTFAPEAPVRHRELADVRPSMAKSSVRKAEEELRPATGLALQRASARLGWSLKELAGRVNKDPRQVARWLNGQERANFDLIWSVKELRRPLLRAFAELCEGVVVVKTAIEFEETA